MSKIKVKNFGPIKNGYQENEGFLDIKKVNIFIGSQGTGKSTITKLLATLVWLEKRLVRGDIQEKEITYNKFKKTYCSYQNITNYFHEDTEIVYRGSSYFFTCKDHEFKIEKNAKNGYVVPKIMYVPAERNFVSAVDQPDKLKYLPAPLVTFLSEYEKAKEEFKENILLPINDTYFEFDRFNKVPHIRGKDFKVRLSESSSGFQSAVPLYLVSKNITQSLNQDIVSSKKELSLEEEKRIKQEIAKILSNKKLSEEIKRAYLEVLSARFKNSCFINIVEEPEQNLYPNSQKNILFELLKFANNNKNNQLIITTHSPYIINYLSLAIKAADVLSKMRSKNDEKTSILENIVPLQSAVKNTEVVIYQMYEDGNILKLKMYEGLPSDDNFLNSFLMEINDFFVQLLEIESTL